MGWRGDLVSGWRSGTRLGQRRVLGLLLLAVVLSVPLSLVWQVVPLAGYLMWLVLGAFLLRVGPLIVHAVVVGVAGTVTWVALAPMTFSRWMSLLFFAITIVLVLYTARQQRTGLPSTLSGALLADLRERLDAQGRVPALPDGWRCETAMVAAHGVGYAGDFMIVEQTDRRVDLVLVDVVGKGVEAAPSALMLAGAIGGMVGSLEADELLAAANRFLLRQGREEMFATAAAITVCLDSGRYRILSAGHPPALRWDPAARTWREDAARGLPLGVLPDPDLEATEGVLAPGDALLFYTDGVVESRGQDIEEGIGWLCGVATAALRRGALGAPRRIIRQVPRGDDDRAVLMLSRDPA
ncbi:PP2C family protein-serine/threonine phosphatase [Nocardioides sp.]|uniref:PP2C family protein-serine/threonine phosphatase n=1 Tax=Nocardioides sp. TaxID=35761 RepID=UPI0035149ED2